jgi:hypothetical protein
MSYGINLSRIVITLVCDATNYDMEYVLALKVLNYMYIDSCYDIVGNNPALGFVEVIRGVSCKNLSLIS